VMGHARSATEFHTVRL